MMGRVAGRFLTINLIFVVFFSCDFDENHLFFRRGIDSIARTIWKGRHCADYVCLPITSANENDTFTAQCIVGPPHET